MEDLRQGDGGEDGEGGGIKEHAFRFPYLAVRYVCLLVHPSHTLSHTTDGTLMVVIAHLHAVDFMSGKQHIYSAGRTFILCDNIIFTPGSLISSAGAFLTW